MTPAPSVGTRPGSGADPSPPRRTAFRVLAALLVLAAGGIAIATWSGSAKTASRDHPGLVFLERDGLRYEFDALTGKERLYDLAEPRPRHRNLLPARAADGARLRDALLRELHLDSLDALREKYRAEAEELRRLGYL